MPIALDKSQSACQLSWIVSRLLVTRICPVYALS